jgi:hypothetical protein
MNELIISLIPLALAAAFQPPQFIALLVLLQTKRGMVNGLAYITGMFLFRLLFGFSFWFLVSSIEESIESSGGGFGILVSAVLMVLGLLLLINALRRAFSVPQEDQAASAWLDKLENVSPLRAGLVGVTFLALDPKDWIMDLAAVNLIADADLTGTGSLLTYLLYLLVSMLFLILPLVLMWVLPSWSKRVLENLNAWMKEHTRTIEIITAMLFGLMFLAIGLNRLGII